MDTIIKPLKIGTLQLKTNIYVAPLAGVTDYPFRKMLRRWGAELTFMEMLPVTTLVANPERCERYFRYHSDEHPIGVQLVGKDPDLFLKALDILHQYPPDIIDLNFSCPVRKIINNGSGAAMMKTPEKMEEIVKNIVKNTAIPVTAKIRLGVDKDSINAPEIAKRLQDAGISLLTVHARTADQKYSGPVNYRYLADIKKQLKIPVIGNGGVYSPSDAIRMIETTGVDGIQIGTGILGRYWFLREIKELRSLNLSDSDGLRELLQHYSYQLEEYDEPYALLQMRKHVVWMSEYLPSLRKIRNKLLKAEKYSVVEKLLHELTEINK